MKDRFGRNITYLRLSVTELCNLRCRYCMPEDGVCKKKHEDMLREDEMIQAVEAAAALGIKKVRITLTAMLKETEVKEEAGVKV
ncbi:MAG: GTP 3',8-cyclase MoaA, partial [Anaerotignum sp.]